MTNSYVSLDTLKSSGVLNITGSGDDTRLRTLIEAVSRVVDGHCNRHFYVFKGTKLFDGGGALNLHLPDLVSVDTGGLKTDDNRDRTFETTWAMSDYRLMPSNAAPSDGANPASRPYTRLSVDVESGSKSEFPRGVETVQVTGQWGWWLHLTRASETANAVADAITLTVTVSSRVDVRAGHTVIIDSEQMYVQSYSGNTLTVVRGVNGTAAASHAGSATIDIYEYPGPITEGTIIQTARFWRRKDSAFSVAVGPSTPGMGLDDDVRLLLGQFRRRAIGVGI